jgi:2,3-bisphosphoglycerate-independent phosphoglycerate mutase
MSSGPVVLVILDGWGIAPDGQGNAVARADTPVFDRLWAECAHTSLIASGTSVGLPEGQIGNSEVGHLNIGAGRIVFQDLARIDNAVHDGSFQTNRVLGEALDGARASGGTLHVIGLASTGGVHSHLRHIEAIVTAAAARGIERVAVHAITDGRDVAPDAALTDIPALEAVLSGVRDGGCDARIATVIGRYWAMDRDRRWDRTKRAYDALVAGTGVAVESALAAVAGSHERAVTDEFIEPSIVEHGSEWRIVDGDTVICANFRPDRMRQICHTLLDDDFDEFERAPVVHPKLVAMAEYDERFAIPVLFAPSHVHDTLADVLERNGVGQLHVAETEKYAHVTYFFNGGVEAVHTGEVRELAESPRDVATYDLKPEMNAAGVSAAFRSAFEDSAVGFGVINFANPDMVGHTGSIPAAIAAVETVDGCLGDVVDAVRARGGSLLITADHGNAEQMLTPEGKPHTAHTTNPVPLILVGAEGGLRDGGILGDLAPTILGLLGLQPPTAMTGQSLLTAVPVG